MNLQIVSPPNLAIRIRALWEGIWPYSAFISLVFIYNYLFLSQGYCPELDEGYLQSLAKRTLDGEQIYLDYYFLRTPLSVYIQTALMWTFGGWYTLMAARVIWAIQMMLSVILVSDLYRRRVSSLELLLLLSVCYVISTLLLSFPWYSYDGVVLAALTAVLYHRRYFVACGVVAMLAGMAKQNYFLLLPLFFLGAMILKLLVRQVEVISFNTIFRVVAGSFLTIGGYLGYLYFTGALEAFLINVLVLPPKIGVVGIDYILFQNNADALLVSTPLIGVIALSFYLRKHFWLIGIAALASLVYYYIGPYQNVRIFIYAALYFSYAMGCLAVIECIRRKLPGDMGCRVDISSAFYFMLIIQYLAGFNYGGVFFAYMGAGFVIPLTYIVFKDFSPTPYRRITATVIMLSLLICGIYLKYNFVYHESARSLLTVEYSHPKLRYIKSTDRAVRHLEDLLSLIQSETRDDDYIFVFPHYPALYFLADRKNPTRIVWYYKREFNGEMLAEAVSDMKLNKPRLIILHRDWLPEILADFVNEDYRELDLPRSIYSDFKISVLVD